MPRTQINLTYVYVMPCNMCCSCRQRVHLFIPMISPGDRGCKSWPGVSLHPAVVTAWETPWRWLIVQPVEGKEKQQNQWYFMIVSLITSSFKGVKKSQGGGEDECRAVCSGHICSQPLAQLPSAPTDGWEPLPERQRFPHPAEEGWQGCSSTCREKTGRGEKKKKLHGGCFSCETIRLCFLSGTTEHFFPTVKKIHFIELQVFKKIFRERIGLKGHSRGTEGLFLSWEKTEKSVGRRNMVKHSAGGCCLHALQASSAYSVLTQTCTGILTPTFPSEPKLHTSTYPDIIYSLLQIIWTSMPLF